MGTERQVGGRDWDGQFPLGSECAVTSIVGIVVASYLLEYFTFLAIGSDLSAVSTGFILGLLLVHFCFIA